MKKMAFAAFVAALAFNAGAEDDESFAAGFGFSNAQCGSGEPTAWIAYDRDSDDLSAHAYVNTGPDGSCAGRGTAVDVEVKKRFPLKGNWSVSLTGGYDQRTVPFEYVAYSECEGTQDTSCINTETGSVMENGTEYSPNYPLGKVFRGVGVPTTSALVGFVYDGGPWTVEIRYNAIPQDMECLESAESCGVLSPVSFAYSHKFGAIEIDATIMERLVADAAITYTYNDKIQISGRMSNNAAKLDNPADRFITNDEDEALIRDGGPATVYALEVGFRF